MSTTQQEIERKYEAATADAGSPDLTGLTRLVADTEAETQNLDATYFDTAAGSLARHRVVVRRRLGGHDEGWHIKFALGDGRQEVHFDLLKDAESMPAAVKNMLSGVTLGEPLEPVARLSTRRLRTLLRDGDGRAVAELCDDTVRGYDHATGVERSWQEWEVELLVDDLGRKKQEKIFSDVENVLEAAGAGPSTSVAKISRALGQDRAFDEAAGIAAPKRPKDDEGPKLGPARLLIAHLIGEYLDDVPALDLGVRAGVPDAVHQLRIRFRGIRSLLRGLRGVIDHDAEGRLSAGLRTTGENLGPARDLEVARQILEGLYQWEGLTHGTREEILDLLSEDEDDALRTARNRLSSPEHLDLMKDLRAFVLQPRLDEVASEWSPKKVSKAILENLESRLHRRRSRVMDLDEPTIDEALEHVHDVRKAAKSLRYAVEALDEESALPKKRVDKAKKSAKRARSLQSRLGRCLDLHAAHEWLSRAWRVFQRRELDRYGVGLLEGETMLRLRETLSQGMDRIEKTD
ncbi:MAG: CYTH and CHAD domain-containing protein [Kocuria sp.]|nr:CYTH and CHAD domain-containing protein [Kocuria sp.]